MHQKHPPAKIAFSNFASPLAVHCTEDSASPAANPAKNFFIMLSPQAVLIPGAGLPSANHRPDIVRAHIQRVIIII
jgi:hypothetical protein